MIARQETGTKMTNHAVLSELLRETIRMVMVRKQFKK